PGMNTEVEIHVGRRDSVLTVPYAALRTQRDVASAATVLGLDPEDVQRQLAAAAQAPPRAESSTASLGGGQTGPAGGAVLTMPDGRTIPLPPGVTEEQVRSAMRKRMAQQELTPQEQALLRRVFAGVQRSGGGAGRGPRQSDFGGSYIVFALRDGRPAPVQIRTGLTDLDHVEVVSGLSEADTVLVLPSASLVTSQRDFRDRVQRMSGGGLPGVQQQQPSGAQRRP
ncbi:MAG: hypothetical protein ACREMV_04050, partial [Gemmatimonadales bacterium]